MPGILIIHATLGTGHLSAAAALEEAFRRLSDREVHSEDVLDHASALLRGTLSAAYEKMSERSPQLYRLLYNGSDADDAADALSGNRLLSLLERPFLAQLEQRVHQIAPEAIVCVHPIPAHILGRRKQEGSLAAPLYVVVTDFLAHSTWLVPGVTRYFLPSAFTQRILRKRGVAPELLEITGIPIRLEVAADKPAAELRARHNLPVETPLITLFGGGIDPQRVRLMVTDLLESGRAGTLAVVAGRNERLEEALADLEGGAPLRLRLYGRIDYVDDLVAASDLVITKAGGLIVSEVLARGTPLLIIDPLPGQEEWNADFVAGAGAGIQLRMPETVPAAALALLAQPERLAAMREQARRVGRPRAALAIAGHILDEVRSQESGVRSQEAELLRS